MNNKKITYINWTNDVGISYAMFQFNIPSSKLNTIIAGASTMEYTESNNVINMTGALLTTDALER